jgi:V8-like Glu-specific endopeptidase
VFHACDTAPGASGAPLIAMRGGKPVVVGVNTGTYVLGNAIESSSASGERVDAGAVANTAVAAGALIAAATRLADQSRRASVGR